MKADQRAFAEVEVSGPEVGDLLDPCPGVIEEQQE
jgi:hypothetical protein